MRASHRCSVGGHHCGRPQGTSVTLADAPVGFPAVHTRLSPTRHPSVAGLCSWPGVSEVSLTVQSRSALCRWPCSMARRGRWTSGLLWTMPLRTRSSFLSVCIVFTALRSVCHLGLWVCRTPRGSSESCPLLSRAAVTSCATVHGAPVQSLQGSASCGHSQCGQGCAPDSTCIPWWLMLL